MLSKKQARKIAYDFLLRSVDNFDNDTHMQTLDIEDATLVKHYVTQYRKRIVAFLKSPED